MPIEQLPQPWLSFLDDLDSQLTEPVELHCLGGFVVIHVYGVARTTNDCDFITWIPNDVGKLLLELAGSGSPMHRKYRVYLDPVTVANYPEDYESRLTPISKGRWRFLNLLALEAHDVALSKLERNLDRDRDDVQRLAAAGHIQPGTLRDRYQKELRLYLARPEREDLTLKMWIESCWPIGQGHD